MRHAKSSWGEPGRPDSERELSPRGRRDAPRVGRWLAESGLVPDHVVCSTARRVRETAEGVLPSLGIPLEAVRWSGRIYEASPADLLAVLAESPEEARRVLMIGHNPGLEVLAERLARGSVRIPPDGKFFPTATVAHLVFDGRWNAVLPGRCELRGIVRPRDLPADG